MSHRQFKTRNYFFDSGYMVPDAYSVYTRGDGVKRLGLAWYENDKKEWEAESFWMETFKGGFKTRAAAAKWLKSVWANEKQLDRDAFVGSLDNQA